MTATWTALFGLAALAVTGLCIWRALSGARTPQGAVAWVIFLLSAPWFAVPAYAVFGAHRVPGYARARRQSRARAEGLREIATHHPPDADAAGRLAVFERITGLSATGGNAAELLIDGEATFEAIFAAIDAADRYVCVQFYTIVDDALGRALADRLAAAAGRGVAVRLIFDGVGSYGLGRGYRDRLARAGVEVVDPQVARGPTSRLSINFRNHRKTVIVDGTVAFLGGHNVSETYLGRNTHYGHWRDTHLALRGPMVAQLQMVFAEDWHWATGELLTGELDWDPGLATPGLSGLVLPTGPADAMETGARVFFAAIAAARRRIWIASPYFVPDAATLAALGHAALAGVDVRLLLTGRVDHYLPWLAAHAYLDAVRADGVKVFRYAEGFMHQKVLLIDDDLAAVGSANFDNRSFRLNFETMALIRDPGFAGDVAAMLERDFAASRPYLTPLAEEPPTVRLGAAVARLLAPVL